MFKFQPKWKEELVVNGPGGSFVLELMMGKLSAYLPSEHEWASRAPQWAVGLWPQLKLELEHWCIQNATVLYIEPDAQVWTT